MRSQRCTLHMLQAGAYMHTHSAPASVARLLAVQCVGNVRAANCKSQVANRRLDCASGNDFRLARRLGTGDNCPRRIIGDAAACWPAERVRSRLAHLISVAAAATKRNKTIANSKREKRRKTSTAIINTRRNLRSQARASFARRAHPQNRTHECCWLDTSGGSVRTDFERARPICPARARARRLLRVAEQTPTAGGPRRRVFAHTQSFSAPDYLQSASSKASSRGHKRENKRLRLVSRRSYADNHADRCSRLQARKKNMERASSREPRQEPFEKTAATPPRHRQRTAISRPPLRRSPRQKPFGARALS